jgi:ubiquitin carboxyl-terminal hydrolase 5/13
VLVGVGDASTAHDDVTGEGEPTEIFSFGLEQRLECLGCHRVRYRIDNMDVLSLGVPAVNIAEGEGVADPRYAPVPLELCIDLFLGHTGQETLEYQCEAGCGKTQAIRRTQLATFPDVLVIHAKKFQLKNWVPVKLGMYPSIRPSTRPIMWKPRYSYYPARGGPRAG